MKEIIEELIEVETFKMVMFWIIMVTNNEKNEDAITKVYTEKLLSSGFKAFSR